VSQLGQDVLVDQYLQGKRNGVFVDIGAPQLDRQCFQALVALG
jgi:hypothetical protein